MRFAGMVRPGTTRCGTSPSPASSGSGTRCASRPTRTPTASRSSGSRTSPVRRRARKSTLAARGAPRRPRRAGRSRIGEARARRRTPRRARSTGRRGISASCAGGGVRLHADAAATARIDAGLRREADVTVDGTVIVDGVSHELRDDRGEQAHVFGRRHADRWGWFHANLPGDGWADGLVAKVPHLPTLAFHAGNGAPVRAWQRGAGPVSVGPYTVEARRGRLRRRHIPGPGRGRGLLLAHGACAARRAERFAVEGVALEYGSREKVAGWPISL